MTTISQDIRAALRAQAITASGFPASDLIADEGMPFTPAEGTTWASFSFRPASQRTTDLEGGTFLYKGIYLIDVRTPAGQGTAAADTLADAIRDAFRASTTITIGTERLVIDYAERYASQPDAEWTMVPVQIGWRILTTR